MQKFSKHKRIAGFTLLELMIASAIGAFLIAGIFTVFANGRKTQGSIEIQTQLIDDGRFALRTLYYDIRHAGLWGKTNNNSKMAGALGVTKDQVFVDIPTMPVVAGDCTAGWYRNLKESFFVSNNVNPYVDTCIPNGEYKANTDVLVVKYAPPAPVADANLVDKVVYVYANHFQGELFVGKTSPTEWGRTIQGMMAQNFTLRARAYFVNEFSEVNGDGYPSLHRIALAPGPSISRTMMIPGVEDMQIQLGYDTTRDGSVNMYVDADNAVVGPEMRDVKSVQFWVMLRSRDKELQPGETQSLSMAGRSAVTYNDGYRRVIVSSVVRLQNRLNLSKAGS